MMSNPITVGDTNDASRISAIPRKTLVNLRLYRPDQSPPHYYVGRRVYYPLTGPNSLESWMLARASDPRRGRV